VNLPQKYYLIDYKLYYFDDPLEDPDIILETDFFQSNPSLGEIRLTKIVGDLTSPDIYPTSYVQAEAMNLASWQPDSLPSFIPSLNKVLNTPGANGLPVVIYFHCECGCDRTGEIAGSYAMTYMGYTYNQAYAWDQEVAGRWILPNHDWAMRKGEKSLRLELLRRRAQTSEERDKIPKAPGPKFPHNLTKNRIL